MIDFFRFSEILDELCGELPAEFFEDLSGGVAVSEKLKISEHSIGDELITLGEYCHGPEGCHIVIYYGSFARRFPRLDEQALTAEIRKTLRHEFRHHIETKAGACDLVLEDDAALEKYLKGRGR